MDRKGIINNIKCNLVNVRNDIYVRENNLVTDVCELFFHKLRAFYIIYIYIYIHTHTHTHTHTLTKSISSGVLNSLD